MLKALKTVTRRDTFTTLARDETQVLVLVKVTWYVESPERSVVSAFKRQQVNYLRQLQLLFKLAGAAPRERAHYAVTSLLSIS